MNMTSMIYLVAAVLFICSIKELASPKTARRGNILGVVGMGLAICAALLSPEIQNKIPILVALAIGAASGITLAVRINMVAIPQLVAGFHSLVGLSATLISIAALYDPISYGISTNGHLETSNLIELVLGNIIGTITFIGSVIAFAKLQGILPAKPLRLHGHAIINAILGISLIVLAVTFCSTGSFISFVFITFLACIVGALLILPIGGADMPVIVSMLNSYSGWAASGIGFVLQNNLLIVTGAIVGSSGAILSYIMCKAMNRSLLNVMFGNTLAKSGSIDATEQTALTKNSNAEEAAFLMKNASSVIIVPGYGMAIAHAQHALREMDSILTKHGCNVKYAIHPVAGRMPGHMNVLLAEAGISYDKVFELEDINREFAGTDVVYVIGANDVTNPAAKTDPTSPIYGMPILDVSKAKTVLFVKRGTGKGYAGVENSLLFNSNTLMLFSDAKNITERIVKELETQ